MSIIDLHGEYCKHLDEIDELLSKYLINDVIQIIDDYNVHAVDWLEIIYPIAIKLNLQPTVIRIGHDVVTKITKLFRRKVSYMLYSKSLATSVQVGYVKNNRSYSTLQINNGLVRRYKTSNEEKLIERFHADLLDKYSLTYYVALMWKICKYLAEKE